MPSHLVTMAGSNALERTQPSHLQHTASSFLIASLQRWHESHHCAGEQAAYREGADGEVGNAAIVRALVEMEKYWDALDGDFLREQLYNERADDGTVAGRKTEQVVNHRVRAPRVFRLAGWSS